MRLWFWINKNEDFQATLQESQLPANYYENLDTGKFAIFSCKTLLAFEVHYNT